jgi:hypothetical protein
MKTLPKITEHRKSPAPAAAALNSTGRIADRRSRRMRNVTAVSGMPMMLCFQNPATTISSKAGSGGLPSMSRRKNQTSAAPMIARPGSFAPT